MVTPLHVEIAMHYHYRPDQHPMLHNDVHRRYAYDLANVGLLERLPELDPGNIPEFVRTDGLAVWINAICDTPFPVQRWVMPSTEDTSRG